MAFIPPDQLAAIRSRKPLLDSLYDQLDQARTQALGSGNRFDKLYQSQLAGFNAQQGLNDYTQGAVGQARTALDQNLRGLRDDASASGRLNSGYFDEDTGRVVRDSEQALEQQLLQASQRAQQLQMQNTQAIGQYAAGQQGTGLDLLSGRIDAEQARINAKQQRKAQSRSGIGTLLGAGVGAWLGGPQGAAVGGQIGGSIF